MKPTMKKIIILIAIPLLFAGCKKLFEPYDKRTYYDVTGEGYVYYYDTKKPAPDAQVQVLSQFRSNGWATVQPVMEYFPIDSNGHFRVRFLKRTERENVKIHHVLPSKDDYYSDSEYYIFAEDLQKLQGVIQIDTLWLKKVIK